MKKLLVVLTSCLLLATACGSRGKDESGQAGGVSTTTAAGGTGASTAGDWGTLKGVCGPKTGGGTVPASAGKDALGVTADSIQLGTIADPGFSARPGLNQEIFDAGTTFVKWCNAAGGINGKKLSLTLHDAKLTDYQPVVQQACGKDFAIVGDGAVQDNLWQTVGVPCGLIDVAGFSVTAKKAGLAGDSPLKTRTVQPLPNTADRFTIGAGKILDKAFPGAGQHHAFLYADFQTLIDQAAKTKKAFLAIGHKIVHQATYGVNGEANWKPFAIALKNAGVQELSYIGEPANGAALEVAMKQIGYTPKVRLYDPNFYDPSFIAAGGSAVNGGFVGTAFIPLEEASTHPATKQYIDLVKANGGKVAALGLQSTSGWLLFSTLAKTCDLKNDLTRTCILTEAAKVKGWTGGGLHAPTDPGTNKASECMMVMQIVDGKFTRFAPKTGDFDCDPSYVVAIKPGS